MSSLKDELIKAGYNLGDKLSISVDFALELGEYCKREGRKQGALEELRIWNGIIQSCDMLSDNEKQFKEGIIKALNKRIIEKGEVRTNYECD